jgi:hypothetical protein
MLLLVCRRAALVILVAAVFSCVLPQRVWASSAVVSPPGTIPCKSLPSYPTISLAVSSVPKGATIYICPGTYAEQVVINKNLTLEGVAGNGSTGAAASGENNPVIVSPSNGVVVNTNDLSGYPNGEPTAAQILVQTLPTSLTWPAPIEVNISNITVDGSNNQLSGCGTDFVGVYYQNASGTLNHVTTRYQELDPNDFGCQDGLAIYAQSGYGTGGTAVVTIENDNVHDYDKNGITADGSGTTATIASNYVVGIGATPLIAQNGIQLSEGAGGKIASNTVTDDVYVNPSDCYDTTTPADSSCYSASGILLYDSGGTSGSPVTVSTNIVSNTQGAIVAVTDGLLTADYNEVSSNRVTTTPAIVVTGYTYFLDGIDLCSDNNTATSNTVFNSGGSGVHLDSSCTEPGGAASGSGSTATTNTVNEACAGVLKGNSGGIASGTITFNVVETTATGDSCPAGNGGTYGVRGKTAAKIKRQPRRR